METIKVCVGSSCYLKGSYDVITEFQRLIAKLELTDKVELKADFCQNECLNAPCVRIGERLITKVAPDDAAGILSEYWGQI